MQIILSGISEITEDFSRQDRIMQSFFERKFSVIIQNIDGIALREEAKAFAKEKIEEFLVKSLEKHDSDIESLKKQHDDEMSEFKGAVSSQTERLFIEDQLNQYTIVWKYRLNGRSVELICTLPFVGFTSPGQPFNTGISQNLLNKPLKKESFKASLESLKLSFFFAENALCINCIKSTRPKTVKELIFNSLHRFL